MKRSFIGGGLLALFIVLIAFLLTDFSPGFGFEKDFANPHLGGGPADDQVCLRCHTNHGGKDYGASFKISHTLERQHVESLICEDCHDFHGQTDNLALIWEVIETPSSGPRPVVFHNRTGQNSYADGDAVYDGVCEVCHTNTDYHRNDHSGDHSHYYGQHCTACHLHSTKFMPSNPHGNFSCLDCHILHGSTSNLALIREVIDTPNSGLRNVVFLAREGPNSFADGDDVYDGVCEVCHIRTLYHRNDDSGDQTHYTATTCTLCHPHGENFRPRCGYCHNSPPDGTSFPNTAGSHATHIAATNGPRLGYCYTCHELLGDNHGNGLVSFVSGTDANGDGNIELSETDVCDNCHSPGGAFNGVISTGDSIGAKDNWVNGVYSGGTLPGINEKWCAGCHDDMPANSRTDGSGIFAPNVTGDNVTHGFYISGHGRSGADKRCTTCHDTGVAHIDGEARTFAFNSADYGPGLSGRTYAESYRLSYIQGDVPLMIPANYGITFNYSASEMRDNAFNLCFQGGGCHDSSKIFDDTPGDGISTNFKATLPNPPRDYSYAWGSGADVNEHVSHILNYIGPFWDSDWELTTTGLGGQDGQDSLTACSSCHNVHGAAGNYSSTNESMIRDGSLTGRTGYGFSYVVEGTAGYPWVTSSGATQSTSVGSILRESTGDMCGGGMCHGNVTNYDATYNAIGSGWGTELEYYRPWTDQNNP